MTTKFSITVVFLNGEKKCFKYGEIIDFEIMEQGMLYLGGQIEEQISGPHDKKQRVKYVQPRYWYALHQIKDLTILTDKEITDPEELRKYRAFKRHNIDIMTTKISYTAPPTQEQIQKIVKESEDELKVN